MAVDNGVTTSRRRIAIVLTAGRRYGVAVGVGTGVTAPHSTSDGGLMSRPSFEALFTTQVNAVGGGAVAPGQKSNLMIGSTSGVPGSCTNPSCVEPSKSLR